MNGILRKPDGEWVQMRTGLLIAAMVQDTVPRQDGFRGRVLGWTLAGLVLTMVLGLVSMGLRPRLGWAMTTAPTLAKVLLPLLVALAALPAAMARARPEAGTPGAARWALATLGLTGVFGLGFALWATPVGAWAAVAGGQAALFCPIAIPVMALPMLAALIAALGRGGASTAPAASGALAGLAAGGLAAAVYALHCIEDAPLFFVLWYGLAILACAGLGAAAGRRWLRW